MKNIILIVVILLSFSARLFASEEDIVPPYEITISADAGKDFGEVVVKIETNKNIENLKITNIELYINGK